jgi:hypothetical protein
MKTAASAAFTGHDLGQPRNSLTSLAGTTHPELGRAGRSEPGGNWTGNDQWHGRQQLHQSPFPPLQKTLRVAVGSVAIGALIGELYGMDRLSTAANHGLYERQIDELIATRQLRAAPDAMDPDGSDVQLATKFTLSINLTTVRALDIDVPLSVLLIADGQIE